MTGRRFGITRAPALAVPGAAWVNAGAPLDLDTLRGKVVILDFWTAGCINCHHTQPVLAALEARFGADLAVIGIHSPKFPAERRRDTLDSAIARLNIRHPVLQDADRRLWHHYAVKAWPTLVVIDPRGRVVDSTAGEPDPKRLAALVAGLLGQEPAPLPPAPPAEIAPGGRFRFPAGLRRLPVPIGRATHVLADSGHHQIVLIDAAAAAEVARIGSGRPGPGDGPWGGANFDTPLGVGADATALWVADSGNHLLRRIDIASLTVTTVAGLGRRGPVLREPLPGPLAALASPQDVVGTGREVFIANAGTHQILAYDLAWGMVRPVAGNGAEGLRDGIGAEAVLAQPSGLDRGPDGTIAFVDAETSALRLLDGASGRVTTLAGQGLFDFGDRDGALAEGLMQHPEAVCFEAADRLLVADTYNGGLRRADLAAGTLATLDLTCRDPLCLPAGEPRGLAPIGDGRFLMAERAHHRLVAIDPRDGTATEFLS
ncbi:thioredoxin-like domain-containing protein [Zavarzinia compransoris]|uniref:Thioredoxin domain-containing protein n=1 Tax=Zavarzinia compransoris TaxID=1264899 RepID=A0A317E5D7_9PROT|nr:thioredoxin-like domain-containing protein [Zavarzinia compransoris]PWR22348.1 hypothetical protein DKG75_10385 [Zavarzinia compransoris]TDP46884.1 thiol-disulfide isomerase/thioredoxin [Zavarzinia compransoris]